MRPGKKKPSCSAYDRALRLLSIRDHAEKELRRKLRRAEHEPQEIDGAIERVRRLGYLNDARFARLRAASLVTEGRFGPRGVAAKLQQAGVGEALVREAVAQAMDGKDELELAAELLKKKHPDAFGSKDPKVRARAARYLVGHGFSSGVVARVLRLEE
ncbi:MAG TPA: RecX family transcriptional regulator [Myxococcales bacterium]|jgi:regulatory protein|nr:RecX family transcriptional regulator [Myxococcales bacterium]